VLARARQPFGSNSTLWPSARAAPRRPEMTAVEARSHLAELHAERGLALTTGVADIESYMADLDEEIAVFRWLYTAAAVTEIATLRAELFGAQVG
jgi:hypothetical protein